MDAMRLMIPMDNPLKECHSCKVEDEVKVSARILTFQLAHQLLRRYSGTWKITQGGLELQLKGVDFPFYFEFDTGVIAYGGVRTSILSHYDVDHGVVQLAEELIENLALPYSEEKGFQDPMFQMFVKLIEIFYARCGLNIRARETEQGTIGWEVFLCEDGPHGWISREGIAENSDGERVDIKRWYNLRPEKLATYVFGFNAFCKNYVSPLKMN